MKYNMHVIFRTGNDFWVYGITRAEMERYIEAHKSDGRIVNYNPNGNVQSYSMRDVEILEFNQLEATS